VKFVDIVSRFGEVTLRLTPVRHPWDTSTEKPAYDMQLTGPDLDCSSVYVENTEAPQTLIEFFEELVAEHKGWDGEKRWASAGEDVTLVASHDQINTTRLDVTMTGGVTPRWRVFSEIHVDPFRFDQVAKNLTYFSGLLFGDEHDPDAEPVRRAPRELAKQPFKRIGTPEQYAQ
jgi:hypothetical protein